MSIYINVLYNYNIKFAKVNKIHKICIKSNSKKY